MQSIRFYAYQDLVWLACTLSFILGLPSFASAVAFTAATSITTIGLYISYGVWDPPASIASRSLFARHPHCPSSNKPRRFQERSFPSGKIFLSCGYNSYYLDLFHLYRLHSTPGQRTPIMSFPPDTLLT
jgi:hypothetical protein